MLEIRTLTPEEQAAVDPTGRGRQFIRSLKDTGPTPQCAITRRMTREDWLEFYIALRTKNCNSVNRIAIEYDAEHDSKYGPQGGHFHLNVLKTSYINSYKLADRKVDFKLAICGRNYLIRRIRSIVEMVGFPQPYTKRITGTSGALPAMLPKGDFITEAFNGGPYIHPFANLPGERYQRLKKRCINQDSCRNVRYVEKWLGAIRVWLKRYLPEYFSAWSNPNDYLIPQISSKILNRKFVSCEIDFEKCDEHTSLDEVVEIVFPVWEQLSDPMEFALCGSFIEELFYQPIFFGDEMWYGKHNLLSGQAITNDIETIYDVCVQIGAALMSDLCLDDLLILSLGDDQTTIMNCPLKKAETFYHRLIDEMTMNGHEISVSKSHICVDRVHFTRKVYYPKGPKSDLGHVLGSYPLVLALNNIVNPERHIKDTNEVYKATLQRFDVAVGNPLLYPFIQGVGSRIDWSGFDADGVDRATSYDWWERVYDEHWSLSHSVAYRILRDSKIL